MNVIFWPLCVDLVGADVLGDAAGLARHHVGLADGVEQRRLAVVDVAHDGDHRRARNKIAALVGVRLDEQPGFDVGLGDAAHGVAHILGDDLRRIGLDHVGGLNHLTLFHEMLDDVDGAFRHAVGELGDRDPLGNDDLAHDLLARTVMSAGAFALAAAANGGERASPLGVVEGVDERELAAATRIFDALDRLRLGRGLGLDATVQTAAGTLFLFLDFLQSAQRTGTGRSGSRACGLGGFLAEAAAGGFLGAQLDTVFGLMAGIFVGLAALSLGALTGEAFILSGTARGRIDGSTTLLGFVNLGVGQRAGAGVDFVGGKLTQHEAGAGSSGRRHRGFRSGGGTRRSSRRFDGTRDNGRGSSSLGLFAGQRDAALLALDLNRVGAAVRETLANGITLGQAAFEAQCAFGGSKRLVPGIFSHACLFVFLWSCGQVIHFSQGVERAAKFAVRGAVCAAIADEISNPRQHIRARRPGEQRSMYHICSTECQIQFFSAKTADNRKVALTKATPRGALQFGHSVGPGVGGVNEGNHRIGGERGLNLAEAADKNAGLAGERQGTGGSREQKLVNAFGQFRFRRHRPLERFGEQVLLHRRPHRADVGRHPDASTGQPPLQIGDDRSVGPGDKANERVNRLRLARDDAGAFGGFVGAGQSSGPIL